MKGIIKKITFLILCLFVIGWAVRVLVPYRQALKNENDMRIRQDSFETLVNRLYEFAETNNERFPTNLEELGTLTNHFGNLVNYINYVYKPSARFKSDETDSRKLVIGENPLSITNRNIYLMLTEGRFIIMIDPKKYGFLLRDSGFNNMQGVNGSH